VIPTIYSKNPIEDTRSTLRQEKSGPRLITSLTHTYYCFNIKPKENNTPRRAAVTVSHTMEPSKLKELKHFIEQVKSNPSTLADPSLSFFRDYLERLISITLFQITLIQTLFSALICCIWLLFSVSVLIFLNLLIPNR